ncbi:MAG TPA: HD-GYP domain-containing protein, partial [Firmicutes bacterium]|nr:HD-GYP domain-containing protein [Bacillota bacterium]
EARDPYTKGHSLRVHELATEMAEHLYGVSRVSKEVATAAQLHDIGKVGIRDAVLNKPGKLTEDEMSHIREHPVIGERIVASLRYLDSVARIVRHHHERFDGTGYPDRLAGDQTPLASRIIAIADAYDAMTSSRPYRGPMDPEQAAVNIREGAGTQFDPALAEVFLELFYSGTLG